MVSTRRSRSSAGGDSEQVTAGPASQEDVSSRPSKQAAAAAAALAALEPISEEPQQQPAPTLSRHRRANVEQQQHVEQVQPEADQEEEQQQAEQQQHHQQQQQQQLQGRGQQQHQQQMQTGQHLAEAIDLISDSDDDDDLDLGFDGPGVLQNLAAAIRSGFQSQSKQQQQQQQPSRLHAAAAAAAAAGRSSCRELDDSELQQLRWRPHTGLHIPAKAAAAVALTQPRQRKKPGQLQEQPVGALVDSAAAAGTGSAETADPTAAAAAAAAAAGAAKQPGLSKALRAPTLDAAARTKEAKKSAPDTAGSKWFDLPAPKITDELKRDLRVLRLRGAYDPKRFYKSFDNAKFPKYFAMGTVVDDPLDNSNRLAKGQRRATLTEQLLVDAELTTSRKRRFNKLQDDAQKWAKHKKRKNSAPRKTPSKHRPKH